MAFLATFAFSLSVTFALALTALLQVSGISQRVGYRQQKKENDENQSPHHGVAPTQYIKMKSPRDGTAADKYHKVSVRLLQSQESNSCCKTRTISLFCCKLNLVSNVGDTHISCSHERHRTLFSDEYFVSF